MSDIVFGSLSGPRAAWRTYDEGVPLGGVIVGSTGTGKTNLLNLLADLYRDHPANPDVYFFGLPYLGRGDIVTDTVARMAPDPNRGAVVLVDDTAAAYCLSSRHAPTWQSLVSRADLAVVFAVTCTYNAHTLLHDTAQDNFVLLPTRGGSGLDLARDVCGADFDGPQPQSPGAGWINTPDGPRPFRAPYLPDPKDQ